MIFGAHVIIYSKDAEADRVFFHDVLGYPSVDAGGGWLIFALPPAELAVHPAEESEQHELFLMCTNLKAEISTLRKKGVISSEIEEARWGSIVRLVLPGGGRLGLYQPKHPLALVAAGRPDGPVTQRRKRTTASRGSDIDSRKKPRAT